MMAFFWISGKPDSGKSTLMQFLRANHQTIKILREWAGPNKLVVASHYFWHSGSDQQKSQEGLLRALAYDVLSQCIDLIPVICPHRWNSSDDTSSYGWTLAELLELTARFSKRLLISNGKAVQYCFFVDGLDEYEGNHFDIVRVLEDFTGSGYIKICASSRPWNVFEASFSGDRTRMLVLQDLTRNDICIFARSQLEIARRFLSVDQRNIQYGELIA